MYPRFQRVYRESDLCTGFWGVCRGCDVSLTCVRCVYYVSRHCRLTMHRGFDLYHGDLIVNRGSDVCTGGLSCIAGV